MMEEQTTGTPSPAEECPISTEDPKEMVERLDNVITHLKKERPIFTKREVVWIVAIVWLAQIITAALTLFALDHYFGPL